MTELVTLDELKNNMPGKSGVITQEAVDIINRSVSEPEFQGETLLQTASIYESVLKGSRASVPEYLNAIRFCAYMMTTDDNYTEAYKRVFSDREFVKVRANAETDSTKYSELTSAASRYRRSKLVIDILTVSQVPLDMIFGGYRYKAMAVLAEVMVEGKFDRDRVAAAKELLAATKGPENVKIELDIGLKEDSAVKSLNDQLAVMAARQTEMLTSGAASLEEFGNMKVINKDDAIDAEFTDESN